MAVATAPKNEEREVFARTPSPQLDENGVVLRCDIPSCNQIAPYKASKSNSEGDDLVLFLCGHHARKQAEAMITKGWNVTPAHYATYGVEATAKA